MEIVWDEDDLFELLVKRIRESPTFLSELEIDTSASSSHVFEAVFPPQVDVGLRKPVTWKWMMSRVRDGNDVRPPRNLIELVKKAQDAQMRREERSSTEYMPGTPVIGSDALKRGLAMISSERVEDTLLAEAGELAPVIEKFRGGKAEHNEQTVSDLLGIPRDQVVQIVKRLRDIGFLEQVGVSYKVPILYREGLRITQGKAFQSNQVSEDDEE